MRLTKLFAVTVAISALAGSALAADLPNTKAPPAFVPPPPPLFTWTGVYVGGQIGYQWGTTSRSTYYSTGAFEGTQPTIDGSGVVGGAHVGYNYQFGQFVAGLEGDVDGSSYSGSGLNTAGTITATSHIPVEGSVRGRVGIAWDRALVYATGGVAFADRTANVMNLVTGGADSFSAGLVGWTAGGGVEYAIDNNWSIRAEYRYTDFGHVTDVLTNSTATLPLAPHSSVSHLTDNAVRVGFSYKFDMLAPLAPVVAKY